MENKTAPHSLLTAPVTIAATCKSIDAAKHDLAAVLKKITDNNFAVEKALNRTAMKKSEIDALKTQTPADHAQEIERKREDLAAAIALGEKSAADLAAFEKEVAIAEKNRNKAASLAEQIKPLEVELRGLRRRIDALNAEGARLQEEKKIASQDLCKAEFEAAGEKALRLANEYRLAVAETVAWGDLHKRLGGSNRVGTEVEYNSIMPLGCDSTHNRTPSFSSGEMVPLYNAATDKILAGLAAEGLELFPAPPLPAAPKPEPTLVKVPGIGEGTPVEVMRPEEPLRTGTGHLAPAQAVTEPEE